MIIRNGVDREHQTPVAMLIYLLLHKIENHQLCNGGCIGPSGITSYS
jgi:hypothetical protein